LVYAAKEQQFFVMAEQIRTPAGESIWKASDLAMRELEPHVPAHATRAWVAWNGQHWLRKCKDVTLCEIIGFQLAGALGLPLLDWVAFFQDTAHKSQDPSQLFGILVKRWEKPFSEMSLPAPAREFPDRVAAGLALGVFDRYEWPVWLIADGELRLIDLERIGPALTWPPQRTMLRDYRDTTETTYHEARAVAIEKGLDATFQKYARKLMITNVSGVLDLSGHPHSDAIKKVICRGLELRQWELRRLLDGVVRPKLPPPKSRAPAAPPRRAKTLDIILNHETMGRLSGAVKVCPVRRGKWAVRWNIGSLDSHVEVSDHWFTQKSYSDQLFALLRTTQSRADPGHFRCHSASLRWGSVRGLTEALAVKFAKAIRALWNRVLADWKQAKGP